MNERTLLRQLHALVVGECPSILDGDKGGEGSLDMEIEDVLASEPRALDTAPDDCGCVGPAFPCDAHRKQSLVLFAKAVHVVARARPEAEFAAAYAGRVTPADALAYDQVLRDANRAVADTAPDALREARQREHDTAWLIVWNLCVELGMKVSQRPESGSECVTRFIRALATASAPARDTDNLREHELKVWPQYFDALLSGAKTFEVRYDDRGFQVGDALRLHEWSADDGYSGRGTRRSVTYVMRGGMFGLMDGYVVMGLATASAPGTGEPSADEEERALDEIVITYLPVGRIAEYEQAKLAWMEATLAANGVRGEPSAAPRREPDARDVWYLAHPVSPDDRFTFEQNMEHALKVARICHDAGFKVCLPWYADCRYLDDTNAEHRAAGLAMDVVLAAKMGRIILTGHRRSSGMQAEAQGVRDAGGAVVDAVGVPDRELAHALTTYIGTPSASTRPADGADSDRLRAAVEAYIERHGWHIAASGYPCACAACEDLRAALVSEP